MKFKENDKIKKGIANYKHEQSVILRALRIKKGMTCEQFNILFGDFNYKVDSLGYTTRERKRPKFRFIPSMNSFLLGDMFGLGDWSKWLHLMQLMIELNLVEAEKVEGGNFYRAKEKKNDRLV